MIGRNISARTIQGSQGCEIVRQESQESLTFDSHSAHMKPLTPVARINGAKMKQNPCYNHFTLETPKSLTHTYVLVHSHPK